MASLQFSSGRHLLRRIRVSRVKLWPVSPRPPTSNGVDLGRRLVFQLEQRVKQGLPQKSKLSQPSLTTTSASWRIIVTADLGWNAETDQRVRNSGGNMWTPAVETSTKGDAGVYPWRRTTTLFRATTKKRQASSTTNAQWTDDRKPWFGCEQGLRGTNLQYRHLHSEEERVTACVELWEYRRLWRTLSKRSGPAEISASEAAESCCELRSAASELELERKIYSSFMELPCQATTMYRRLLSVSISRVTCLVY